ncbi:MAG: nickel pincer cofactor biosynthesis protein LarC [Coriobacteriales bacterium]
MIAHMDISTGASGDKIVGSLLQVCTALGIYDGNEFSSFFEDLLENVKVDVYEGDSCGIEGLHLHVEYGEKHEHADDGHFEHGDSSSNEHGSVESDEHDHDHGHATSTEHEHDGHHHHHEHRSWSQIESMLSSWHSEGKLQDDAFKRAMAAFKIVAEAESQVHGVPLEEVHFHEVGAIDSIVDIVGASLLMSKLDLSRIFCTPITVGYGTVDCAHGTLPVPAPATAKILEGMPIVTGAYEGEMTTPTGAALLKANVTDWAPLVPMVPRASGFGLGDRQIPGAANCLRTIVGDAIDPVTLESSHAEPEDGFRVEGCVLLQTNIDHISPEIAASCCEDLMSLGAKDVWQQPVTMKKGRLGFVLNVLVSPEDCDEFCKKICELTGTLGVRRSIVERTVAPRIKKTIQSEFGEIGFKVMEPGSPAERQSWVRPESDDVARVARQAGIGYPEAYEKLMHLWESSQ